MSNLLAVAADLLVAVLLAATIVTSLRLSRRIRGFTADEASLRRTIGELGAATDTAERAISGLRATLSDCERALGDRLRQADVLAGDLGERIRVGQGLLERIGSIAELSRRAVDLATGDVAPATPRAEPPGRAESLKATGRTVDDLVRRLASRAAEGRAAEGRANAERAA